MANAYPLTFASSPWQAQGASPSLRLPGEGHQQSGALSGEQLVQGCGADRLAQVPLDPCLAREFTARVFTAGR
jgi:hypothetical protein